ncbi:hypothetical protein TTHERM_00624230 (macronuclear) [Tetrahymena thermophila SB210]|uniref:Uncharacterized protein n=1 Tax=Tetrahymena thermophila (strain SB210) TaxID=312017 RepID=Q240W0_TETTS|nr:hypothetical protein TTHERM_00624230 [Tetrahymena thermophila SB210]EAS02304.1 hypothetical protein TTHERM_00624230 [Tetrahymena thermophila SB210]|eukprot:XP_001022549.1 hypothetical protein TTHERM_00624230 [Tetrahymena thermophila SB210]
MSTLFSGFATRQQQQLYENLIEQLISVLSKRVIKIYDGQSCNEQIFKSVLLKIMVNLNILEERKYAAPKLSQQVQDLMGILQLDYLSLQSQQQNGVIKPKKKEYYLINQSDLVTKKPNQLINKQRSITPSNGSNPVKTKQGFMYQVSNHPSRVNSSSANNRNYQNPLVDGQVILPPQTAIGGDKNGFRVKLYNKQDDNLYGPNIEIKQGSNFEESSGKNTIQSFDASKEIGNNNLKENSQYLGCYESVNVRKNVNNNSSSNQKEQQQDRISAKQYLSYNPEAQTLYSQRNNDQNTLSPSTPVQKNQFQNQYQALFDKIADQDPQLANKFDSGYTSISASKGYVANQDLDCPQPSYNFPSEQKSVYNNNNNNSNFNNSVNHNKSTLNEEEVQMTMIDQDIIKKIINIAPQISKLSKQERSIDKQFRKLRKKSQPQNHSLNNSTFEIKNDFEFDSEKFEQEFYYGNFLNSTNSSGSQKMADTARSNRKNGFFSAQRSNFKQPQNI